MEKCIVCDNNQFQKIYKNTLLKCENCGFITANIDISKQEFEKIYGKDYFHGKEYSNYKDDKQTIQKNFKNRLCQISRNLKKHRFDNVLEIGCAYGFFGELIQQMFPEANYKGYDIAKEAIEYAQNELQLNVECTDYLTTESPEIPYTDVFMWDVIEHLPNPNEFIQKIVQNTSLGSHLFITTGDISALIPRIKGASWRMIHPPTHLHYFSKNTLKMLLEKNGFEVVSVRYPPVSRSIKQIFFSLFILNKHKSRCLSVIYNKIPASLHVQINTLDIMFLMARKI